MLHGPIGSSAEGSSSAARVRLPHPTQRFVVSQGAPSKVLMVQPACVSYAQHAAWWPHRELHTKSQWRSPLAVSYTHLRAHETGAYP
eukprot:2189521-Pyramimonas_sp.AAC.1